MQQAILNFMKSRGFRMSLLYSEEEKEAMFYN